MQKIMKMNKFDEVLIKIFGGPASLVLLAGEWKTGKTDFALLIAERLLEINVVDEIASNIKTNDDRIKYIDNLTDLKDWLFSSRKRKLYIFDEVGVHIHKRTSMSKKNIAFIKIFPEISKARARLLCIMQNPESIDKELLHPIWCKALIIKENKFHAKVISELLDEKIVEFDNIPRTTIKFDPYDSAIFDLTKTQLTFKDKELNILYEWSVNQKSIRELGLHPQQLNRIVRKFIKNIFQQTSGPKREGL